MVRDEFFLLFTVKVLFSMAFTCPVAMQFLFTVFVFCLVSYLLYNTAYISVFCWVSCLAVFYLAFLFDLLIVVFVALFIFFLLCLLFIATLVSFQFSVFISLSFFVLNCSRTSSKCPGFTLCTPSTTVPAKYF